MSRSVEPLFVLSNDDGPYTGGLAMIKEELSRLGRVITVVPHQERSGSSHMLTLDQPLTLQEIGEDTFTVDGAPADCTYLALFHVLKGRKPDLVVAGLNNGYNMGEDVIYSGTVAAAMEGFFHGIPAVALSAGDFSNIDTVRAHVRELLPRLLAASGTFMLNINYPGGDIRGTRVTRLSSRVYPGHVEQCSLSRFRHKLWIGGVPPVWSDEQGTDISAVTAGFVSVTPLTADLTDRDAIEGWDACLTN